MSDAESGSLTEGPFLCGVTIDDGRLTAVNSDLTTGTVRGEFNVSSHDGSFSIQFVIQLSDTGARFTSAVGVELGNNTKGETEKRKNNTVSADLTKSTVIVTPRKDADGETIEFTLKVSLTLVQNLGPL